MKIAVIGGIGCGKSSVVEAIKDAGYITYDCDVIAKELMQKDFYISKINENFKDVVFDGKIDKKKLAEIVFSNINELEKLNSIAHPLIKKELDELAKKDKTIFVEVSAFKNSGLDEDKFFDKVLLVEAPLDLRVKRILKRDNRSIEIIKNIINSQPSDEELEKYADCVILNDEKSSLKDEVKKAIDKIL